MPDATVATYAIKRGDVLFNRTSETDTELALAATYVGAEPVVFGGFVIRGRPSNGELDPDYCGYALRSQILRSQIIPLGQGAVRANIGQENLGRVLAPVPDLAEQRAIAASLSDVDALIAGLERLVAKKRDVRKAAMQQLLTGQARLPGFSRAWTTMQLGQVGECLRGVTYRGTVDLYPHDTERTKRLLRSNNVQGSTVVTSDVQFVNAACVNERQILRMGDVLICMANGSKALVGKAAYFNLQDGFEYTYGAFMGAFRSHEFVDQQFVSYLFQTARY